MANTLITPSIIAKTALVYLKNKTVLANLINRDYDNEFAKVGDTIQVRKPVYYSAFDGPDITSNIQDTIEGKTSLQLAFHKTVPLQFLEKDLTLTIEEFGPRYIETAAAALAQQIESAIAGLYKQVWNYTAAGTLGTPKFEDLGTAGAILSNAGVPFEDRRAVLNPTDMLAISKDLKTVFVQDKVKTALEEAKVGRYAKFDTYESASIVNHTVGAYGGTPLVNGANQTSTYANVANTNSQNLVTDGWTATTGALKAGDVFTIANVFAVNIRTQQSTGALQTFVVNSDVTADGSGNMTISISPAIITTGPNATVNAAPADNAAITVKTGTASAVAAQGLTFHKNAFTLAMRPFQKPESAVFWSTQSMDGFSLTVNKGWDFLQYKEVTRLDVLFGVKAIYPDLACRFRAT